MVQVPAVAHLEYHEGFPLREGDEDRFVVGPLHAGAGNVGGLVLAIV